MAIELPVEEIKEVAEGKHEAVITRIGERIEPYHYIDIYFKLEDGMEVRYGVPAAISEKTRLGKILAILGQKLSVGEVIDLEKVLVGKKVSLMTINEDTEKGKFAKVVDDSIKSSVVHGHVYRPQLDGSLKCECGSVWGK